MSMSQARKLCPQVVIIEPNFEKYRAISAQIHSIFQQYTTLIEPLSLDEAYLDVTENLKQIASATEVAMHIREDIFRLTGLTASAGVAPNKFLAKVASDWNKPNGLFVIKALSGGQFHSRLALKKKFRGSVKLPKKNSNSLSYIRWVTYKKIEEAVLVHHFGKYGQQLYLYAQGIDHRPVQAERARQQISKETTFDSDFTLAQCQPYWQGLAEKVWQTLEKKQLNARGVNIKLKLKNFQTLQHSKSF